MVLETTKFLVLETSLLNVGYSSLEAQQCFGHEVLRAEQVCVLSACFWVLSHLSQTMPTLKAFFLVFLLFFFLYHNFSYLLVFSLCCVFASTESFSTFFFLNSSRQYSTNSLSFAAFVAKHHYKLNHSRVQPG